MAVIPPITLGLARFVVADVVLLAIFAIMRRRPRLAPKDLPLMAGAGLVGVTLYFLGENNGVLLLSASRITSYNVCYTKLLRTRRRGGKKRISLEPSHFLNHSPVFSVPP